MCGEKFTLDQRISEYTSVMYIISSYCSCSPHIGLPPTGSWQDLKDHMREAGEVCYANVESDGTGVVEFLHREEMKHALSRLNDTKFKSHEVSQS